MYYEVIPTRVFREDSGFLTYFSDQKLTPGTIVEIPLGRSHTFGVVIKKVPKVSFETKPITRTLYDTPLPPHILKSILWLSKYYLVSLPVATNLFLPTGLGKKRRNRNTAVSPTFATTGARRRPRPVTTGSRERFGETTVSDSGILLNQAQKKALSELKSVSTSTKLLHGITGSGKTNVYLDLAKSSLKAGESVILLVPEIALTSQLVEIFKNTFKEDVILIHSKQTEAERHLIWEDILSSDNPRVIIGPRSALLSPVKNLGLIIIDEAHESTYSQDNNPKYSALRLASFMAGALKISCIYGTATPLVSDYYLAKSNNALVSLKEKAKSSAKPPDCHIIDLCDRTLFTKNRYFSDQLLAAVSRNLKNHHQTLIFHNRRGSAPLTICENCGWQALCPNCFLPLTLHSDTFNLICHTCGFSEKVPSCCPDCKHPSILHKGFGTKLLESELKKLFKDAKIIRFDADNKKTETLDSKFDEVKSGKYDIIIGTQTIAKGLDLPLLATVGVVQADSGLSLPDFASEERTFHLLTQVIGRVGRGHLDTAEVFIQTFRPNHPVIAAAISANYEAFADYAIKQRKIGKFPPFYYLAKVSLTYKTEALAIKYTKEYRNLLKKLGNVFVSNPTPAFHEQNSRGYTWQFIARAHTRKALLDALASLPKNPKLSIHLDPPTLL
ncbi:primosomal protein N' [Candidatus Saccharibacteria bacterium]|nr:primosomal protein N' [Candidatus Saccharibacteria bacterium]